MFDRYEVRDDGTVYSKITNRELKQVTMKNGYKMVSIYVEPGVRKQFYVHRLVAEKFLPNPSKLPCVNHIDGDKTNNVSSNLEWVNYGANEIDKNIKLKGFLYASRLGVTYGPFKSVRDAIDKLSIEGSYGSISSSISKVLVGEYKEGYGYKWFRE
jgi:hypothetical protein